MLSKHVFYLKWEKNIVSLFVAVHGVNFRSEQKSVSAGFLHLSRSGP